MEDLIQQTVDELKLRYYSPKTTKIYTSLLAEYLDFKKNDLRHADTDNIRQFLLLQKEKNKAPQTINLYLNAIKFFYRHIAKSPAAIRIRCAKRPQKLPVVLSREEILQTINCISNLKHKTMIAIAYAAGLRVSEVVSLKVQDIDFSNLALHIKNAKGKKDRLSKFSDKLVADLKHLSYNKQPDDYIFESEQGGKLNSRSIQKIFTKALKKTGIKKNASFHSLRHSFATHLIENNTSIRVIQELLGHNNIRTTQRYTRVSQKNLLNVISPL